MKKTKLPCLNFQEINLMINIIGIYGASGFGREVLPLVKEQYPASEIVFIDDAEHGQDTVNGVQILTFNDFLKHPSENKAACIAIANSLIREKLYKILNDNQIKILNIKASNVIQMDEINIDEGFIISPFVTLTSNIIIGKCFQANIYSYVAHDCIIGDYVTFAPGVKCNGNVHIHNHAYIGTGAIIKQGTPSKPLIIGKGAVIGMGAVVTKSVAPGVTVVGNPAKPLSKQIGKVNE